MTQNIETIETTDLDVDQMIANTEDRIARAQARFEEYQRDENTFAAMAALRAKRDAEALLKRLQTGDYGTPFIVVRPVR